MITLIASSLLALSVAMLFISWRRSPTPRRPSPPRRSTAHVDILYTRDGAPRAGIVTDDLAYRKRQSKRRIALIEQRRQAQQANQSKRRSKRK